MLLIEIANPIVIIIIYIFFIVVYPTRVSTAPNHLEPVILWHPQLEYVVRLKVVGRGRRWGFRSGHQIRLKSFQAMFRF